MLQAGAQALTLENLEIDHSGVVDASQCRKLAILGLPWDTSEETLRDYFAQFGALEAAEVMKDRYTGKSRGFGFVSFVDPTCALRALNTEHTIDGRRCEAKVALPKGDPTPPRTTRIFVARIPPSVTETQFRSYFESFGKLQDAYMPKDHSKQGYRGIGFVTYAVPDSVEKIMAVKHWLNGHEIAIDRATPKEEPSALKNMFARPPLGPNSRRSFDNGAGIIGPGLINTHPITMHHMGHMDGSGGFGQLRHLSEDRQGAGAGGQGGRLDPVMEMSPSGRGSGYGTGADGGAMIQGRTSSGYDEQAGQQQQQATGRSSGYGGQEGYGADGQQGYARANQAMANMSLGGIGMPNTNAAVAAAAAAATNVALQSLAQSHHDKAMGNLAASLPLGAQNALHNLSSDISASLLSNALNKATALGSLNASGPGGGMPMSHGGGHGAMLPEMNAAMQQLMAMNAAAVAHSARESGRRSLDAATAQLKRMERLENPAIANARAGPRIFIGKLTKETTELDVREYFSRFGYVMDVYLPKSKDNKGEHRGFGFVTFETEAAIQRVVQHGTHRLKGSTIAIDLAMPKVEEEGMIEGAGMEGAGGGGGLSLPQQLSMLQRI